MRFSHCLWLCLLLAGPALGDDRIALGRQLAIDQEKGNCLPCHAIAGAELHGDVGPALVDIRARFPDRADLRAQIWDATEFNADTLMPPYGRHGILSEEEIDLITDFIYAL
jgi:sulfur-oxidizing protein SoxX